MKRKVQLVLREDVHSLGSQGDVVSVPLGFAKNFLLPRKKAELATQQALSRARVVQQQRGQEMQHKQERLQEQHALLHGKRFLIKRKVSERGTLYDKVNARDICSLLQTQGVTGVEGSMVRLPKPIAEAGEHEVEIQLAKGASARVMVIIEGEQP